MSKADLEKILAELDTAHEELRAARTRLAQLMPMSATKPGESGQARIEFVVGLESESEEDLSGEDKIRQINAAAWDEAQAALVNAQEKVELAHRAMRAALDKGD